MEGSGSLFRRLSSLLSHSPRRFVRPGAQQETDQSLWTNLPPEVLFLIFSWLGDIQDIYRISLVCKQWYEIIWFYQDNMNLKHLANTQMTDSAIESLSNNCPRLSHLHLSGGTDNGIKNLQRFEMIESLNMERCFDITDASIEYISHNENLKDLTIARCTLVTDEGVKHIQRTHLTKLSLFGLKKITKESVGLLGGTNSLKTLRLHGCSSVTDEGIAPFANSPQLKSLDLSWCAGVSGKCFEPMYKLQNLQTINVRWNFRIDNEALGYLGRIESLTDLNFVGCEQITIEGIKALNSLKHLKSLNLGELIHIGDESILEISNSSYAPVLESLVVRYCVLVSDDCFVDLHLKLLSLRNLSVQACFKLTDICLEHISRIKSLERINITANYFTERGFTFLLNSMNLKEIQASQCPRLTDRTLERVAMMQSLEEINLIGCKRISRSALAYFCDVVCPPSLKVIYSHD